MTPVEFCYWLRGSTELHPMAEPSPEQWASIREHVALATSDLSPEPINIQADRFCQWLNGAAKLSTVKPGPDQWLMIQEQLRQVFVQVTRSHLRIDLRPQDAGFHLRDLLAPGAQPVITC